MHVAAVVEASWHDIRAVLVREISFWSPALPIITLVVLLHICRMRTYILSCIAPEYSNVLGPSAKVNGRGPDISQFAVSGQNMVYVVATLFYTQCQRLQPFGTPDVYHTLDITLPAKSSQFSARYPGT